MIISLDDIDDPGNLVQRNENFYLRIKNKWFAFVLDGAAGEFPNTALLRSVIKREPIRKEIEPEKRYLGR